MRGTESLRRARSATRIVDALPASAVAAVRRPSFSCAMARWIRRPAMAARRCASAGHVDRQGVAAAAIRRFEKTGCGHRHAQDLGRPFEQGRCFEAGHRSGGRSLGGLFDESLTPDPDRAVVEPLDRGRRRHQPSHVALPLRVSGGAGGRNRRRRGGRPAPGPCGLGREGHGSLAVDPGGVGSGVRSGAAAVRAALLRSGGPRVPWTARQGAFSTR